jgi:hypothetical protein
VGQYRDRRIHQVDPDTGAILRTIESNRFVTGVTWVDGALWHGACEGEESDLICSSAAADGAGRSGRSADPGLARVRQSAHPTRHPAGQDAAPTHRRNSVVWIHMAKRPDTRERRIRETVALLAAGKKLGLK